LLLVVFSQWCIAFPHRSIHYVIDSFVFRLRAGLDGPKAEAVWRPVGAGLNSLTTHLVVWI
jgi:hypothetical protein